MQPNTVETLLSGRPLLNYIMTVIEYSMFVQVNQENSDMQSSLRETMVTRRRHVCN